MVAARSAFLDKGYYAPLLDCLSGLIVNDTAALPAPVLVDSGCGEGYYTAGIFHAWSRRGNDPGPPGWTSSKFA